MKFTSNVDFGQNQSLNRVMQGLATAPSSPKIGQEYWNTTSNVGFFWNGTVWRPIDAAGLTDGSILNTALATNPLARANHTGTQLSATISDLSTVVHAYTLDTFAAPLAAVSMNGQKITSLANGSAAQDAVTFSQMNAAVAAAQAGQTAVKNPVRVFAAGNIALTGLQTIDGVSVAAGDRVGAFNQTTQSTSNIYVAASGAWALATDVNTTGQLLEGTDVLVAEGTLYAGTVWRVATVGTITIGTTAITWTQVSKINTYTADAVTLTLTGYQFSALLAPSGGVISTGGLGLKVDPTVVVQKYAGTITGNAATTSFPFTHNLNNSNPTISCRDSSGNMVLIDNVATSANVITFTFSVAPAGGVTYSVAIQG